jgi:hypothetical protein
VDIGWELFVANWIGRTDPLGGMLSDFPNKLWHSVPIPIAARLIQRQDIMGSLRLLALRGESACALNCDGSAYTHFWICEAPDQTLRTRFTVPWISSCTIAWRRRGRDANSAKRASCCRFVAGHAVPLGKLRIVVEVRLSPWKFTPQVPAALTEATRSCDNPPRYL